MNQDGEFEIGHTCNTGIYSQELAILSLCKPASLNIICGLEHWKDKKA